MYRTLAWHCLEKGVELPATAAQLNATTERPVVAALRRWKSELKVVNGAAWLHVDGYLRRRNPGPTAWSAWCR
jgi:hypothetical protein